MPLSAASLAIIKDQPILNSSDLLFTTNGRTAFSGFSKAKHKHKHKLDSVVPTPWRLRDIRRTAKSLMSKAGALPYVSEHVLGHVLPDMQKLYDRHAYLAEKRDALDKLAAKIEGILKS